MILGCLCLLLLCWVVACNSGTSTVDAGDGGVIPDGDGGDNPGADRATDGGGDEGRDGDGSGGDDGGAGEDGQDDGFDQGDAPGDGDGSPPADESPTQWQPDVWGPYEVGVRKMQLYDGDRHKLVDTLVWYPAVNHGAGDSKIRYLLILEGNAYEDLDVQAADAPYPLVLFSHGNKGVNFQSYSFTSFLASHGFFVASCNHRGNTMFDNPDDAEMAAIALERPYDIAFVYRKMQEFNQDPEHPFYQKMSLEEVGMAGHSFGGYTALMVAGGTVDVDAAAARCQAGTTSDVFCPYIGYWPAGEVISRPAGLEAMTCTLAMAPGGYGAFGDEGLAGITMPVMIMAGIIDEWMPLDAEPRPIYAALTGTAYKLEIERAGHMNFTDICRIPLNQLIPDLAEMCDPNVYLDADRSFEIINPFAAAFFRRHLKGETGMDAYLSTDFAATFPEAAFESKP